MWLRSAEAQGTSVCCHYYLVHFDLCWPCLVAATSSKHHPTTQCLLGGMPQHVTPPHDQVLRASVTIRWILYRYAPDPQFRSTDGHMYVRNTAAQPPSFHAQPWKGQTLFAGAIQQ